VKHALLLVLLGATACGGDAAPGSSAAPVDSAADMPAAAQTAAAAASEWPAGAGPVNVRRERAVDLTGDGQAETVAVTARGPRYDSLTVTLTITGLQRDTLWLARWSSLHYFKYDTLEGKADTTVMRIVQDHIDGLLAADRFRRQGMPSRFDGTTALEDMRAAVQYHLAELDWRGGADLTHADELPPDAHSRIDAQTVSPERVSVVIDEVMQMPTFSYYAGGEETYTIAWSAREHAFVRVLSCC
jgi:hypothetical protein